MHLGHSSSPLGEREWGLCASPGRITLATGCCVKNRMGSDKGREAVRRLLQESRVLKLVEGAGKEGKGYRHKRKMYHQGAWLIGVREVPGSDENPILRPSVWYILREYGGQEKMCSKSEERNMALFCRGSQWEGSCKRLMVGGRRRKHMVRHTQVRETKALGSPVESHQREPRLPRDSKQQTLSKIPITA